MQHLTVKLGAPAFHQLLGCGSGEDRHKEATIIGSSSEILGINLLFRG
jgi:hypothetical protein